jgi:hypothetical protein
MYQGSQNALSNIQGLMSVCKPLDLFGPVFHHQKHRRFALADIADRVIRIGGITNRTELYFLF